MHPRLRVKVARVPRRRERHGRPRGPDRPPLTRGVPPFVLMKPPPSPCCLHSALYLSQHPSARQCRGTNLTAAGRGPPAASPSTPAHLRPPTSTVVYPWPWPLPVVCFTVTAHVVRRPSHDPVRLVCPVQHFIVVSRRLSDPSSVLARARSALMAACRYSPVHAVPPCS